MAHTAEAGEIVAALGGSDIDLDSAKDSGVAELSYRFDDASNGMTPAVTVAAYDAGYVYAGAGIVARRHMSGPWFAEAGAEIGVLVSEGEGDLAVRGAFAVGRRFGHNTRASLGLAQVASGNGSLTSATLRMHLDM